MILGIIQGKTTVSESSRQFDLPPSEIGSWIDQSKAGTKNALKAKPEDIREQYETKLKALQEAYGEAMLELSARKKLGRPADPEGRDMILQIQRSLKDHGISGPITKLCAWLAVPRRTVRYEWLAQYVFDSLDEAREFATRWMWSYNHQRPNMALGGITPKQRLAMAT